LAALFEYLCDRSAVTHNPVKGVSRPKSESGKGKTPALGDHQARELLAAPLDDSIRSKRDRALLSTLLFHALRREELCKLKVKDFRHARKGVPHLKVSGKGGKTRYLPLHPGTHALIHEYIEAAGHSEDDSGALFRPIRNNAASSTRQSRRTAFTSWCAPIRRLSASRSGRTRCGRLRRRMRSIMRPIS
jgi:integrase/recombinase XerD